MRAFEPLDWLRDNTGPLARDVTSAAIALEVMQAEDPLDAWTKGVAAKAERGPYTRYLKKDALKGKRFAVPWFVLEGSPKVYGTGPDAPPLAGGVVPETRAALMKAIEQMRRRERRWSSTRRFCRRVSSSRCRR